MQESDQTITTLALEIFRTDAFLGINKKLLENIGIVKAGYIMNLVDKYKYFQDREMLTEDGGFFLTYEQQTKQLGLSEYQLRKCKNEFTKSGVIKTEMRGIPPKEFYFIDFEMLLGMYILDGTFNAISLKKLKGCTLKNLSNIKDNKLNKNKLNLIYGSTKEKEKDETDIKNKNKEFLHLAEKLATTIQSNKNIKVPPSRLQSWAGEIRKLSQLEGVAPARIEKALDWYAENIGGQYIPVIESGASLRSKFIKLEEAMKRAGALKRARALPNKTTNDAPPDSPSPKQLIKERFKGLSTAFEKECYAPATELLVDSNTRSGKARLAQTLITLYEDIETTQTFNLPPDTSQLFPSAITIIRNYIDWIEKNDWIKDRSINLFEIDHTLFTRFRRAEASKDNMERDPITGKSYIRG